MTRVRSISLLTAVALTLALPGGAVAALPVLYSILDRRRLRLRPRQHLATQFDHVALRDVLNALDPAHAVAPSCSPVLPILGG